jgi:hypothetical protein
MDSVPGFTPMSPPRIGIAHFWPDGQQRCVLPVTQHDRPFGQQPAFPQQRLVFRSQHFFPHSSSLGQQRLQRPVLSLMHFQFGGQQLSLPHHAWFGGHRFVQTSLLPVPMRIFRHSSFGLQHSSSQPLQPRSQQSRCWKFAQYSVVLQQFPPQFFRHTQAFSPPAPQRYPSGQATIPLGFPPSKKQHLVEPGGPQVMKQMSFAGATGQAKGTGNAGVGHLGLQVPIRREALAPPSAADVRSAPGTAPATRTPPRRRSARERGIGLAIDRASVSRNSVMSRAPPTRSDHYKRHAAAKGGNP